MQGEPEITDEHVENNQDVRQVLTKSNIYPENLPPEEDIKKLEKRLKKGQELPPESEELPLTTKSERPQDNP